jgi:hypothetical protein
MSNSGFDIKIGFLCRLASSSHEVPKKLLPVDLGSGRELLGIWSKVRNLPHRGETV